MILLFKIFGSSYKIENLVYKFKKEYLRIEYHRVIKLK
jgi:hypothetical protein